jgi:hypothetical protein
VPFEWRDITMASCSAAVQSRNRVRGARKKETHVYDVRPALTRAVKVRMRSAVRWSGGPIRQPVSLGRQAFGAPCVVGAVHVDGNTSHRLRSSINA